MRIAVVGAGGVGGYFGGRLADAGIDTVFIVRGATLNALRTHGLTVESPLGNIRLERVNATGDPSSVGPVDVILLAVKAWQIEGAAGQLAPMIGEDTLVVPLENGIDAPEILAPIVGAKHVAGGLCAIVSYIVAPGQIRHATYDPFVVFGELDNAHTPRIERLREAFERAGVKAEIAADIRRSMWAKFLFIAPMSGIGALTRVPVHVWRAKPELRAITTQCLEEIVALAHARGVELGADAVSRTWERYDAMPPGSTASMQRDIMEGKPSELEAQLGAIVRLGRESGVATPVTQFVYQSLLPQEELARNNGVQT